MLTRVIKATQVPSTPKTNGLAKNVDGDVEGRDAVVEGEPDNSSAALASVRFPLFFGPKDVFSDKIGMETGTNVVLVGCGEGHN